MKKREFLIQEYHLKRVRENSQCTIVLDNDSLLESNPDLTTKACYNIANSAIMHVVKSLETVQK